MSLFQTKKKGFTLVELLIVIGIISIIIAITIVNYGAIRKHISLDLSANTIQSTIVEVREKARSGFYDESENADEAVSICFGFKVEKGGFIQRIKAPYDRLGDKNNKCIKDQTENLREDERKEEIYIKSIKLFGEEVKEFSVFFEPPTASIEMPPQVNLSQNQNLQIVVGYESSDEINNQRVIILNMLTGNTFTDRFDEQYQ